MILPPDRGLRACVQELAATAQEVLAEFREISGKIRRRAAVAIPRRAFQNGLERDRGVARDSN
jgi:hypothetical protein